jgi:hypothetical protein
MIVYRGNPGKKAFIAGKGVKIFPAKLGTFLERIRRFQVVVPGKPGKVIVARPRSHRRTVIPLKMIMRVDESGIDKRLFFKVYCRRRYRRGNIFP